MSDPAGIATSEKKFQNEIVAAMVANGWRLGESSKYNRESALYPEDLLGFVQETQEAEWQKYCKLYRVYWNEKVAEFSFESAFSHEFSPPCSTTTYYCSFLLIGWGGLQFACVGDSRYPCLGPTRSRDKQSSKTVKNEHRTPMSGRTPYRLSEGNFGLS